MGKMSGKCFLQYTLGLEGVEEACYEKNKSAVDRIQKQFDGETGVNDPEFGCQEIGFNEKGETLAVGRIHARTASECKAILGEYKKVLKREFGSLGCKSVTTNMTMGGKYI